MLKLGIFQMAMKKTPGLKMYVLLKLGIFHSYDGLPEGTRLPGCPWKFVTS